MKKSNIIELDVRPILASGVDPFEAIMEKVKVMKDDQTLLIINSFEPVPLLNILKDKGYTYETERPDNGVVHTFIRKENKDTSTKIVESAQSKPNLSFDEVEVKFEGNLIEIDVRDLEMPLPMVTILEEIEKLEDNNALFVHHKKLPQYLLPELENRGFSYVYKDVDSINLKLIIYK
ncbi:MAG: DUF2249 domain-containing protein [Bacteroidetes bacterium]|nr:DUF2249 domain-containing protein [Bacteroidota bacterium]